PAGRGKRLRRRCRPCPSADGSASTARRLPVVCRQSAGGANSGAGAKGAPGASGYAAGSR
ncbi:hypothetical protein, partial [Micromonospora sp. 4G55]|uniref:hypothetical protein n=1 Tax=Micromonospora sp. 4G55 TaxID=2806102 RepID=UPI001EE46D58